VTPTIVIAGERSGVGKTTIATGLMAAFVRRGLRVQAFKVGPDYIDPSYHTAVTGRPSRTLDGWLLGRAAVGELFEHAAADADLCVVEGVMGLFDGRTGTRGEGSTAELAALLDAPVLLVVDGAAIARSAAAIVHGYRSFDPAIQLGGVLLNRLASEGHYRAVAPPIEAEAGIPVLGSLRRGTELVLPERYLGLIPITEGPVAERFFEHAAMAVEDGFDLDGILHLARRTGSAKDPARKRLFPATLQRTTARIAIARDRAFSFYYADGLDLLEAWGAELVPFSPLEDEALPDGTQGVYIGGGFPELFAAELAANVPMLAALRAAAGRRIPVYGECGGYMYLGQSLTDATGQQHRMAGLLPLTSSMTGARLTLGYREVRTLRDGPLAQQGTRLRGHEFHWSVGGTTDDAAAAYEVEITGRQESRFDGAVCGAVWGSYIHLHFGSDPSLAPRFVRHCSSVPPLPARR